MDHFPDPKTIHKPDASKLGPNTQKHKSTKQNPKSQKTDPRKAQNESFFRPIQTSKTDTQTLVLKSEQCFKCTQIQNIPKTQEWPHKKHKVNLFQTKNLRNCSQDPVHQIQSTGLKTTKPNQNSKSEQSF